jgi:hypothetical protein
MGAVLLAGCEEGNTGTGDAAAATPPAPDDMPFATAAALLDRFNELNTTEPVDLMAVVELYHAENHDQRLMIQRDADIAAMLELEWATRQRFGPICWERIDSMTGYSHPVRLLGRDMTLKRRRQPSNLPAVLIEASAARAVVAYNGRLPTTLVDARAGQRQVHLVRLDGRWWISGYTLEHARSWTPQLLADLQHGADTMARMAAISRAMIRRIDADEFATLETFAAAWKKENDG